ncbi:MAG: hypothetical protein U0X39_04085 [Bacteroidales bacterium]
MKNSRLVQLSLLLLSVACTLVAEGQSGKSKSATQYLNEDFTDGTVLFKNGSTRKASLNLNVLSGKIIFSQNGKYLELVNAETIDTVFIGNRKFIKNEGVFIEVLVTGPLALYRQYKGSLMSPAKSAGYGTTSQTSSITSLSTMNTPTVTYDMKLPDGYTVDLSYVNWMRLADKMSSFVNERQLLKLFPGKEEKIREYIRKSKTDFSDSASLVLLVKELAKY